MSPAAGKFDFERVKSHPSKFFDTPSEIIAASGLTKTQKLELLHSWEEDAVLMQRAEAENMTGGEPSRLAEVVEAINRLEQS